ncbi:hypothetical protein [Candidatus Hodarchaeum mangrovi]
MIDIDKLQESPAQDFISAEERWQQLQQCYRFGIPSLDALTRLYPGSVVLFQGDLSTSGFRTLVTRLTLSLLLTNSHSQMAFIDGANLFPFFEIGEGARRHQTDPLLVLDRIQLARAFNFHQVTEIITNHLPDLIRRKQINIIMIPQISAHYLSKEALQYQEYDKRPATSSLTELNASLGVLKSLALQYDLVIIMTATNAPQSRYKALGGTYLAHSVTNIIRVDHSAPNRKEVQFSFELLKDPERPVSQVEVVDPLEERQLMSLTHFWR